MSNLSYDTMLTNCPDCDEVIRVRTIIEDDDWDIVVGQRCPHCNTMLTNYNVETENEVHQTNSTNEILDSI